MKCKFPNLKCVSRSGTECKLNICALENEETEVKHTVVKKQGKICPILKKECIKKVVNGTVEHGTVVEFAA